jgi:ABC-type dipeptide/oligopeptide/nickel transport system permease component
MAGLLKKKRGQARYSFVLHITFTLAVIITPFGYPQGIVAQIPNAHFIDHTCTSFLFYIISVVRYCDYIE